MSIRKKIVLLLFVLFCALFFSCSARIEGTVREGGAADLSFNTSLEPRTIALLRSLRGFMGGAGGDLMLDGEAMSRSIGASPGIRSVSVKNTAPSALEGAISLSSVGDFLASSDEKSRFITYTEGGGAGTSSVVVVLERASAPDLIARLSPEAEDYLSALMAPAVLGETSTKKEYLELLASVYGRPLADEIAAARVKAFIEFPRPVREAKGGTASGRKALFDIPLVDILVMESPLRYEVFW